MTLSFNNISAPVFWRVEKVLYTFVCVCVSVRQKQQHNKNFGLLTHFLVFFGFTSCKH